MSKRVLVFALGAVIISIGVRAEAEEKGDAVKRVPLQPALLEGARSPIFEAKGNTRKIHLDRYAQVVTVVRTRSEGKKFASFTAEPQLIERGSVVVFEIRSEGPSGSLARWRCIAKKDVAECLGSPVRLRYLSDDEKMVLSARLEPDSYLESLENKLPSS